MRSNPRKFTGGLMEIDHETSPINGIQAVLLDIEGTTTSISFVKDTLFEYVHQNIKSYVTAHFNTTEFKADVDALRNQVKLDISAGLTNVIEIPETCDASDETVIRAIADNVSRQMDADRKTTSLKQLQGHMWRSAYEEGNISGHDVPAAFKRLTSDGIKVYIYSSGSVEAQKLLFGFSMYGNLLQYISGHFDTTTGMKQHKESYCKIADHLRLKPSEILFLTDIPAEAVAATSSGMNSALLARPGNAPLSDVDRNSFRVLSTFEELFV